VSREIVEGAQGSADSDRAGRNGTGASSTVSSDEKVEDAPVLALPALSFRARFDVGIEPETAVVTFDGRHVLVSNETSNETPVSSTTRHSDEELRDLLAGGPAAAVARDASPGRPPHGVDG